MNTAREPVSRRLLKAEFLKIYASRMPLIYYASVFCALYLWVFSIYHIEHVERTLKPQNFFYALPLLFKGSWTSLIFHAGIISFVTYWIAVESQYGMIRVACTQPASRVRYLLTKYTALSCHVVLIVLVYLLGMTFWSVLYTGLAGFTAAQARVLARFSIHVLTFTLALAWIAMAAATFRRTVGTALVTACIACIALGFLTTLPHSLVPPRFIFMRYFLYPLGDLPNPWGAYRSDNPFRQIYAARDFYLVMLVTPMIFVIPAIFDFKRRDITE